MPTWFLPPDFTFAADGPIQLGTVIAHPKKPTQVLATLGSPGSGITLPRTGTLTEPNHAHNRSQAKSNGFSIWAQILAIFSASVDTEVGSSAAHSYSAVDHEVRTFAEPLTAEAALKIAALPAVQQHIDTGSFGKRPVYIVSGVRIAKASFTVKKETGENHKIELSGSGPPVPGPVAVELGASAAHSRENMLTDSYNTAPEIVFAYRVHVVRPKRVGIETEVYESKSGFMTGPGRDVELAPVVVEGTKQELDLDFEEEHEYEVTVIDDDNICISF